MSDVGIEEQLVEAKRELAQRLAVYPRWIDDGRISAKLADRRVRLMEAIIGTLEREAERSRLL